MAKEILSPANMMLLKEQKRYITMLKSRDSTMYPAVIMILKSVAGLMRMIHRTWGLTEIS